MIDPVRGKLRKWRHDFDVFYSTAQGRAQGMPSVVGGERLATLRSQVIDDPHVPFRGGICNAGLVKVASGYLAVAKNNTYCFCREHGIPSDFGPEDKPARARLLLVALDDALRVTRVEPLEVQKDGVPFDDDADLREDARLTDVGGRIWCSVNLVPGGLQWNALPAVGCLERGSAKLAVRSVAAKGLRSPQKNWIPFASGDGLYLEYSINPHVVWRLDPETLAIVERHSSWFASGYFGPRGPFYRGGAPLVPFDGSYLGAGHSMVLADGKRDYRTHFYVTDSKPPFAIRWFGRPIKLVRPERIQYVSALVPYRGDGFIVSYGWDDCDNVFAAIDAPAIRNTLRRV